MKKIISSLVLVFLLNLCFFSINVFAAELKYIGEDSGGNAYYIDLESIYVQYNKVFANLDFFVVMSVKYSDYNSNSKSVNGVKAAGYVEIVHFRLHKGNRAYQESKRAVMSKGGHVLKQYNLPSGWRSIERGSIMEEVYEATYEEL